jgi:hypothetical protein
VRVEEIAAADIVATRVGGQAVPRDVPGAPDTTHDFDVQLADGRAIALEVTSAVDPEMVSMRVAHISESGPLLASGLVGGSASTAIGPSRSTR